MRKTVLGVIAVILFASSVLLANGKINKVHLSKTGKDDAAVNCVYCHKTPGANLPKKKGQDLNALYKTPYCAGHGCHNSKK